MASARLLCRACTALARSGYGCLVSAFLPAAEADVDRLRELDDALRQDVPGAAGWRNDPQEFGRQTFGNPEFDPATYLLSVEEDTG
jgi:hypothetical protein